MARKFKVKDSKRMKALRRKRGRMLGVEGPKSKGDGAKYNRQAKAEYIRKTPTGDGARLKPGVFKNYVENSKMEKNLSALEKDFWKKVNRG